MQTIKVHVAGDNFIPASRDFAPSSLRADLWKNQNGTDPTATTDGTSSGGGFWDISASDLLDSATTLGQTVITTKGQVDIGKAGAPKPSVKPATGGTPPPASTSHKTLYTVLAVVGVIALVGGIYMAVKRNK
jgi:hypothetical protein